MPRKNTILRRITIILLALLSPAFAMAQDPDPSPDPEPQSKDLPYGYGFETELATEGWTINTDPDGEGNITAGVSSIYYHSGSNSFVFSAGSGSGHDAYLISPELSITEAARMIFYLRKQNASHACAFKIGTSTTTNEVNAFTFGDEITNIPNEFATHTLQIADPSVKYVAFWFYSQDEPSSLVLDDIRITPQCDDASNFHYTKISMRSVSLAWDDNSEGTASYKVKNGDEVVATVAAGEETNCVINGLNPNTEYTLTLYTYCGDDPRTNTMSLKFTTVTGPVVEGYVCGGGRMADVRGSSRVTVANCGHLYAVYGGNDITGEVKAEPGKSHYGTDEDAYRGAEVIVGTENTEQVLIDYVYGGGSGLYHYPGIGSTTTSFNGIGTTQEISYIDGSTVENGQYNRTVGRDTVLNSIIGGDVLGYYPTGDRVSRSLKYATITADDGNYPTLPKVERTRIFVNSDNVYIDSLFGGAENAQVGKDVVNALAPADTSVSITINKGTVFALFGGNNYGGLLGKGTYQHIVVNDTKKNTSSSLNLGGDIATGKSHSKIGNTYSVFSSNNVEAHGIRYLFGGGNNVMARNVHVEIKGGQIDTLFAGGNSADVVSTTVEVNVTSPLYPSYDEDQLAFDIRCLFGGNNEASMYGRPTLNITKGGIHTLYGGGNNGLMLGKEAYADNNAVYENGTSAAANAYRSTKIEITGSSVIVDTVYGGGQSAGTINDTYIKISSGEYGAVFGGTNILGNIGWQGDNGSGRYQNAQGKWVEYAKTNILMKGGKVNEALFGGSNGYYLCPDILLYTNSRLHQTDAYDYLSGHTLPSVWQTNVWIDGGNFYGSIYGGGNIAPIGSINTAAASNAVTADREGNTYVLATNGHQWANTSHPLASLFGGGNYANIYGNTTVVVKGTVNLDNNVYGGNDKTGTVTGGPSRMGSYSSLGSDNVAWDKFPGNMTVSDRHIPLNAQNAPCYVLVEESPYIWGSLYGGGNGYYNYYSYASNGDTVHNTDIPWKSNADGEAPVQEALFCGGSLSYPDQTASFVDLNASPSGYITIMKVFGGGNFATVGKEVTIGTSVFPKGNATVWLNNTSRGSKPSIYSIFGGNNHVDMDAVPRVYLLSGGVSEVYGGGNEGGMTSHIQLGGDYDYEVGTCVILASNDVLIDENIYGGCNAANVAYDTYVGIFKANIDANVFGGNNVSGNVNNTHILVDGIAGANTTIGGEIFGGGNGNYSYTLQDREPSDPYRYYTYAGYYNGERYSNLAGRPTTDVTSVVVKGEVTMNGNIFGGGLAGSCRQTLVDIDAPDGIFDCTIFGGGKGDISNIGNGASSYNGYADGELRKHVGSVTGTNAKTEVHIRNMESMNIDGNSKRKAIFGGGYSGDVEGDTYVKLYPTNKATIPAVYLGGVAADVTGTAVGLFDGYTPNTDDGTNIVDTIYGGNDFTGKVYATDITINSGTYQHVFGAGNGDYVYHTLLSSSGFSSLDTVPYSMKVDVVYNGGTFRGNVYGGGNLGLVGNRDMNPGNMSASNTSRYADLGHIHVVINNGIFKRHVYGGARGKSRLKDRFFDAQNWNNTFYAATHPALLPTSSIGVNIDSSNLGRHLVYGLKQIDMYGGEVFFSLHGGSESVDDGTPYECIGPTDANTNFYKPLANRTRYTSANANSTLRPSSIVNIVGGHIRKSLYGGGYQGNIYGSVYVNIGAQAVKDSPVWTRFASMRIDDNEDNTIGSMKPDDALLVPNPLKPLKLDASVYNCADWGEAGDKAYFNTRGVFGGETNIIIDGEGYNTTGAPTYSGNNPEMNIAFSVIGAGTSTEGGDINRLIVMRNYGSYICPKPLKSLYSIQRADKVVLDKVYINLYGEQDAFESYASPNFSLNRLDTLALCNDNVLNIESPANHIGLHASMKGIDDVYHLYNINGSSPNLVTNTAVSGIAQAEQNLASNDILDNQVGPTTCGGSTNECELMDVCALVPTNRGDRGLPGKFNTIIVDEGAYMKISPFVDIWDMRNAVDANGDGDYDDVGDVAPIEDKRDGVDDNDDAWGGNEHPYGHVFGYTYLVAPLETMGYVYGIFKYGSNNTSDGGFVSPCTCNNAGVDSNEIDYVNVTNSGPYRTWKIGTSNGLRKRNATLIANKEPDNILNWPLSNASSYTTNSGSSYNLPGSHFAYATAAIELPPAKEGNFYIVETIDIDQANGGEMHLIDEGYEAITNKIFQAPVVSTSQELSVISNGDEDVHNITFGLTMSGVKPTSGGRVTNFDQNCWIENLTDTLNIRLPSGDTRLIENTSSSNDCWPITGISGGTYFANIGGYISNAVKSTNGATDGILPRMAFTLTYDTRISNTIARDVKFRMLEYDKDGNYVGPIDVTVTINTVIRNFSDIEAPVLAMYNEGLSDKYVRRINIPASFMQRDLYLEDIKWERNTDTRIPDDRFYLQGMDVDVTESNQFAIQVSPVEMVSNTLNNHLGWYDIVEENRYIDLYQAALDDLNRRTGSSATSMSTTRSANYTSWNIGATAPAAAVPTTKNKVTVSANNSSWGDVTGSGDYNANATASLTATPKTNYIFNKWSDGVTNNARSVTVTADSSFIANFYKEGDASHTVTVTAGDGGTVTGGGVSEGDHTWYKDSKVTVTATPNSGYHFVNWDGDETKTANPYTFTVGNENITHIATFAINQYTVTANVNKSDWGSVNVSGTGTYNTTATLTASANSGYEFANWSDGVTTNPREYNVKADSSFTANFKATDADERTVAITAVKTNENETAGSVTFPTGENIHWYEGSVIDISATPASGFTFTHWSDSVTDSRRQVTVGENDLTLAASFVKESVEEHYNGTMPTYGHVLWHDDNTWGDNEKAEWYDDRISSTSLHGREGIKIGTLDGRAPATLDVTLKYNGDLSYHDHFAENDPGPLAWAYLKLHWYNTNTENATGPDDGIFWVKVKLRTREKGDTIYMAPPNPNANPALENTLIRQTVENVPCTTHYWNHSSFNRNGNIQSYANDIRNNPDSYVHTFKEALNIYQEGDVIDIMETIEIDEDDSPLSVGNNNYVCIQIIRYSGSHYKFPSLGCANPNTLVKVKNGGRIAFRNITFNGSGATRVKKKESTHHTNYQDSVTVISGGQGQSGQYYNASGDRIKAIYFAESPIIHCDDGGQLSMNEKVSLINNFNKASNTNSGFVGGGAIAVTNRGTVSLGDNTVIRDNLVVEHGTVDNYGGGVYVDGGVLRVGPHVEDADCYIDIHHNYYYKGAGSNVLNAAAPAGFVVANDYAYKIDTTASNFSLSNVYLTRTPFTETLTSTTEGMTDQNVADILKVRNDNQGDRIHFTGVLSEGSRIGVSKWFPGYRYSSTGNNNSLNNTVPRDTVSIAVLTGSTKGTLAQQNFTNNVFFNDSNYFAQTSGTRSFNTDNNYTEYHTNSTAFPNYNDQVYTFYHNYVNDKTIYLQRCASFGKGVSQRKLTYTIGGDEKHSNDYKLGDSISFRMNPDATCMAITDTIIFKVGGGFFPYTYHWDYDSVISGTSFTDLELNRKGVRDRQTYEPNSISNFDVTSYAAKRLAAENDTLVLYALEERQNELQSTYFFQATANDATGNCSVTQPIMVRVVKNLNNNTIADASNFLMHGNSYLVGTPGVDSSAFHDHADHVPTSSGNRLPPSGTTTITPSYQIHGTSGWEADPNAASYASYSDNKVPRYMRSYLSFQLSPQVMPVSAQSDITVKAYPSTTGGPEIDLVEARFCPGSIVYLTPRAKPTSVIDVNSNGIVDSADNNWEYMSWNFDPSSGRNTVFTVGTDAESNKPTIYYSPNDYWWQVVNTYNNVSAASPNEHIATRADYETDYYGDVTIKTNKGLAWLISVVNGYNGQSARTFHFNTVTIDPSVSANGLDMQAHKWTPVGNNNNPFEGTFIGNGKIVKNLIVNEESLPLVGMFGYTDSAIINNLTLSEVQMKGNSYIGSLIGQSNRTTLEDLYVSDGILFSEYVVGGIVGKADPQSRLVNPEVSQNDHPLTVKGNAIYFGGIAGEASGTVVINPVVREINQKYLAAYYSSPFFGTNVPANTNGGGNKPVLRSEVHNGYAHLKSVGNAERLGGLVGRAEALNLYNCYVYGEAKATEFTGALAGYVGSNVDISNCYYVDGLTNNVVGYGTTSAVQKSSSFHGRGKQVLLTDRVDGYNNLLRALNGWVNAQNNPVYKHWRPAVGDENGGYPLFGDPEMIEVFDTFNIATCDSYDLDGITLTQSGTYTMHFVDSTDYLDSTVTIMLTVNYGDTVEVVDTVMLGQGYEGYGISLTAEQVSAAFGNDHSVDIRAMMYIDSLLNANGCDSLVMLTLYIVNNSVGVDDNSQLSTLNSEVKIYPNPTRGMVNVEGDGLLSVEVYDNISRRVHTMTADGKQSLLRFDMSQQVAGSYYIRVKTIHGTVVKKLIKK